MTPLYSGAVGSFLTLLRAPVPVLQAIIRIMEEDLAALKSNGTLRLQLAIPPCLVSCIDGDTGAQAIHLEV